MFDIKLTILIFKDEYGKISINSLFSFSSIIIFFICLVASNHRIPHLKKIVVNPHIKAAIKIAYELHSMSRKSSNIAQIFKIDT